jgi:Co/Zn/Cd efflux system component
MSEYYHKKESKTLRVFFLSTISILAEIIFGIATDLMVLLNDSIHMDPHLLAIGLSWLAYIFVLREENSDKLNRNPDKIFC